MSNFNDLVLTTIMVLFPITIYFIYNCYQSMQNKYNELFLKVSLLTSLYLSLKFGNITNNYVGLLLCNVPIIASFYKRKFSYALVLMFINILYCYFIIEIDVIVTIIKFVCYIIIYLLINKLKRSINTFIDVIAVVQVFFITFEFFFKNIDEGIVSFIELFVTVVIFYVITFVSIYLYKLADKITNLYQEVKQLEQEKKLKDSLFKLTHEIKNPLAVCQGYLSMLDPNDIEKTNKYFPIIKQEISRSLDIMTDFMEYSKIKVKKELLDVDMLLEDVYDSFKILIKKNINFEYIETDDEKYIYGDYNRLKQVLINIIKNSKESILNKGNIIMKSYIKNKDVVIEIIDDGIGMSKEELLKINEMFYTTKKNGTGIGIPLSNEIIKEHNGKIKYDSCQNKGTTVKIELKLVKE